MDRQEQEAQSSVALDGNTRRACNNPWCDLGFGHLEYCTDQSYHGQELLLELVTKLGAEIAQVTQERDGLLSDSENYHRLCNQLWAVVKPDGDRDCASILIEELAALRKAVEPFIKEAQNIAGCYLHDTYEVGKIQVKHWRALLATEQKER